MNYLFQKIEKDGSYSRIIVNADHPAQIKYLKNLEILRVTFRYGHFNQLGVPQWHNGKIPEDKDTRNNLQIVLLQHADSLRELTALKLQ